MSVAAVWKHLANRPKLSSLALVSNAPVFIHVEFASPKMPLLRLKNLEMTIAAFTVIGTYTIKDTK